MAEIKTVNLEVNSNLSQTETAVTSLRSELRKAQAEVAAMSDKFGAASKEAIEAAKKAAELKDRIGDAKNLTDAFNPDAKFKALAGAANIAAGALAGFEGAMGLVGVQSDEAQQAILKVQSALALSQGLNALQEIPDTFRNIKAVAINAFQGIKGAIGATGIGLLVVALGALYANWDALKKLVGDSVPALKEGSKQFDKLKEVFFGVGNAIMQYLIAPIKAVLKLLKLDFKGAINEIKNGYDVIGNYEKGAAKERQDQNDAYAKARLEKQIKNKENEIAIAKASGKDTYDLEKYNLHRKLILNKGNQEELEKLRQEERLLDATHKKALQDKQTAHNAELKKNKEEAAANDKKLREDKQKEEFDLAKANVDEDLKNTKLSIDEKRNIVLKNNKLSIEDRQKYLRDLQQEEIVAEENHQKQIADLNKRYDDEKANRLADTAVKKEELDYQRRLAEINSIAQTELEKQTLIEKLDAEHKERMGIARKSDADKEIEIAQKAADAKLAIQNAQLDNVSKGIGLLQNLGIKNKAIQKGLLIADSAAGIAKIIINTQAGNAKTISQLGIPAATPFVLSNNIGAAISIASALAATAKGLSALGGGSGGSAPSMGGTGSGAAPSFNVVGQGGANQIAQSINNQNQSPIQAFVVAQNVTTAQGLNRAIINNASLG